MHVECRMGQLTISQKQVTLLLLHITACQRKTDQPRRSSRMLQFCGDTQNQRLMENRQQSDHTLEPVQSECQHQLATLHPSAYRNSQEHISEWPIGQAAHHSYINTEIPGKACLLLGQRTGSQHARSTTQPTQAERLIKNVLLHLEKHKKAARAQIGFAWVTHPKMGRLTVIGIFCKAKSSGKHQQQLREEHKAHRWQNIKQNIEQSFQTIRIDKSSDPDIGCSHPASLFMQAADKTIDLDYFIRSLLLIDKRLDKLLDKRRDKRRDNTELSRNHNSKVSPINGKEDQHHRSTTAGPPALIDIQLQHSTTSTVQNNPEQHLEGKQPNLAVLRKDTLIK